MTADPTTEHQQNKVVLNQEKECGHTSPWDSSFTVLFTCCSCDECLRYLLSAGIKYPQISKFPHSFSMSFSYFFWLFHSMAEFQKNAEHLYQNTPVPLLTLFSDNCPHMEGGTLTQAVETQCSVIKKEADVACPRWHAAEGVSAAWCQWINATGDEEDHQRPCERVLPCSLHQDHGDKLPQEVPAGRNGPLFTHQKR